MAPSRRIKYTEEDDQLMWTYYVSQLRQKDPSCKHPSLQFWTAFKQKYGWERAVSGIESHFRKYLKENIHKSGLRERYLFTAMKKLKVQLNLMDYDGLERKFNCTTYYESDMTFQKALRGDTELSKLPPLVVIDGPDYPIVEEDNIFEESVRSVISPPRPSTSNQPPTVKSSPISPAAMQLISPMRPTTSRTITNLAPSINNNDSPIARRTRSRISITPNTTPIVSPQKRKINESQKASTSTPNQQTVPILTDIKSLLIERLKMVLNGELEANKLDEHPLLSGKNVRGFENFLKQQKVMLTTLMANNNHLRFFDKDFGSPQFKKRKPLPMPKIIKIEPVSSPETSPQLESNVSTDDDDRYPYAYLAIP